MGAFPSAALQFQPPKSPAEQLKEVAQLKSLGLQQQEAQQNLQTGAVELQQKQQALKDQQAMTAAMQEWDGKDLNGLIPLTMKHGASANAVMGLKNNVLAQQEKYSQIAKNDADTGQKNIETLKAKNDMVVGALKAVEDVPDEQLGQHLQATAQDLVNKGVLDPQHAQAAAQLSQLPPAQARQQLKLLEKSLMGNSAQLAQAKAEQEAAASAAELPGKVATSQKEQAEATAMSQYGGLTQGAADTKYRFLQMHKNLGETISVPDQAFIKAYERQKTLNTQFQFNLQNAGATGTAGQPSAIAQAIANGDMKWNDAVSVRTPMSVKQALLKEVKQINPQFNSGDYSIEQAVKKEFTSGDAAKNLTAFNTAIEHANQLSAAADALNNGNIRALNNIGNQLGYQFGSDKANNFNVIKNALTGEISKVFKGGQATDAEIQHVMAPFDAANSPAQLKGAIKNAITLMNSKRDALKQQYEAGAKAQPNFGVQQVQPIYATNPTTKQRIMSTDGGKTWAPAQ